MAKVILLLVVLYTGLVAGANPAGADVAAIAALRDGSMKRLLPVAPVAVGDAEFTDPSGGVHRLADWQGQWLLVNFWATWCAPCRKEMPALNALQVELGGAGFQVLTIATGRNPLPAVQRFLDEVGAHDLPVLLDPKQALARQMGVFGLPVSILVDPEGREVARLIGDADWSGASARAIIAALLAGE